MKSIGSYTLGKVLGSGVSSIVYRGNDENGKEVAVKIFKNSWLSLPPNRSAFYEEIQALKKLKGHRNITQILHVFNGSHSAIVMDIAQNGDLLSNIQEVGTRSEASTYEIFVQIVTALKYVHENGFAHLDVKPENIFCFDHNVIKLGDFNGSFDFSKGDLVAGIAGTSYYMAPEAHRGVFRKFDGTLADVYSCGVILFELITGTVPFPGKRTRHVYASKKIGMIQFPDDISAEGKSLITGMLEWNPASRLTLAEVLSHPWMKQVAHT